MYIFISFIIICICFYILWKDLDSESKENAKENEVEEIVFNQPDSLLFFDTIPDNTVEITPDVEEIEPIEPLVQPKKRGRKPKII